MKSSLSKESAEKAIETLLQFIGEDPEREGLKETPQRVIKAFAEYFSGYNQDPADYLKKTFEEVHSYHDIVMLKDIEFQSFCEHHMALFSGMAHVAYIPENRVVGISKLARLVDIYAKRLQIQEKMTAQIGDTLHQVLQTQGTAVVIEAKHTCMSCRGVKKSNATMTTMHLTGCFKNDRTLRQEILHLMK